MLNIKQTLVITQRIENKGHKDPTPILQWRTTSTSFPHRNLSLSPYQVLMSEDLTFGLTLQKLTYCIQIFFLNRR